MFFQEAPQFIGRDFLLLLWNHVGYQVLFTTLILVGNDQRLSHSRMLAENRFNLSQFDTKTTELDLVIEASEKVNASIR
jgi:hypothetical protein